VLLPCAGATTRRRRRGRVGGEAQEEEQEPRKDESRSNQPPPPAAHHTHTRHNIDIAMTSTCLAAIRATLSAPWFPLLSGKESRAPCVPSSLKPKSQSRRGDAIVAHG